MQFRFVVSVLSADIAKKFTFGQTLVSALSFRSISLSADREKILFRSNTSGGTETLLARSLARHGPNMSSGNMGHFNTNLHFIEPPPSLHSSLLADRDRQRPPASARARPRLWALLKDVPVKVAREPRLRVCLLPQPSI